MSGSRVASHADERHRYAAAVKYDITHLSNDCRPYGIYQVTRVLMPLLRVKIKKNLLAAEICSGRSNFFFSCAKMNDLYCALRSRRFIYRAYIYKKTDEQDNIKGQVVFHCDCSVINEYFRYFSAFIFCILVGFCFMLYCLCASYWRNKECLFMPHFMTGKNYLFTTEFLKLVR